MFYNIKYLDSTTYIVCESGTVSDSECGTGVCRHVFDNITFSICALSSSIDISVSSTNAFGEGRYTDPVRIGMFNRTFSSFVHFVLQSILL